MVAALLRNQVAGYIFLHRALIDAELRVVPVRVGLFRAEPVPAHPVKVRIQRKEHRELRQLPDIRGGVHPERHIRAPVRVNQEGQPAGLRRVHRQLKRVGHKDAVLPLLDRIVVGASPMLGLLRRIHGRDLPLAGAERQEVCGIIFRQRPPEIRARPSLDEFATRKAQRYEPCPEIREEIIPAFSPDACIVPALHIPEGLFFMLRRHIASEHQLPERDLVAGRRPARVLTEHQGGRHRVFALRLRNSDGAREALLLKRRNRQLRLKRGNKLSLSLHLHKAVKRARIGKEHPVLQGDHKPARIPAGNADLHRRIAVLHFLHLGRGLAVNAAGDAVPGEAVVVRPVVEVAAVAEVFISKAVLRDQRLVDIIPDEAALVEALLLREVRILNERTVRVAHRMRIFTGNVGLLTVLLQKCADLLHRNVHRRVDVRRLLVALVVVAAALVVDKAGLIPAVKRVVHQLEVIAAHGLISERPQKDRRMILVALIHRAGTVQHHLPVLRPVTRDRRGERVDPAGDRIPHAVGLKVGLVDHIEAVVIAQAVELGPVRVVAGPDRIDIVPLHRDKVLHDVRDLDAAAALRRELVPVHTVEDDPLPVQAHDAVLHLEAAEADLLGNELLHLPLNIPDFHLQRVEFRVLRAPLLRSRDWECDPDGLLQRCLGAQYDLVAVKKSQPDSALRRSGEGDVHQRIAVIIVKERQNLHVPHMHVRICEELHIPENAREAEEVLVLAPGTRGEAEDLHGEAVFIFIIDVRRQVKLGRREAVLRIADIVPVEPERKPALDSLEGNENLPPLHHLRHIKEMHVARSRIVFRRDLSGHDRLVAVPGILGVDVGRRAVALQFKVPRNTDIVPAGDIIIRPVKILRRPGDVGCPHELPDPVQRNLKVGNSLPGSLRAAVVLMVRMRREAVFHEFLRIGDDRIVKFCHFI